jgi:TolB-like protein
VPAAQVIAAAAIQRSLSKRWLAFVVAAVATLLLAIGGLAWFHKNSATGSAATASKPSIVVPPLQNLSSDPDGAYFSDGMTDEITTKLAKIQGIDVASHSSVLAAKPSEKSAGDVGRLLNVRYLLEGNIRKAQDQVRINVHLTDSTTGYQVWADDFTGQMKDVFSLQEQTALKIAQALNLHLSPQEQSSVQKRYTQNPQAYEAFLMGRALYLNQDPDKLEPARKEFEEALKFDPNYAPAVAGLSHVDGLYYRNVKSDPSYLKGRRNWPGGPSPWIPIWPMLTSRLPTPMDLNMTTRVRPKERAKQSGGTHGTISAGTSCPGRWATNSHRIPWRQKKQPARRFGSSLLQVRCNIIWAAPSCCKHGIRKQLLLSNALTNWEATSGI